MSSGREIFEKELRELGYEPESRLDERTSFSYRIRAGSHAGKEIKLGFEVPADFRLSPPHGPHFSPRLQPINPGASNHPDRVHESPFGPDWQHWSRPYPAWRGTESVAAYMAYVDHLFEIA